MIVDKVLFELKKSGTKTAEQLRDDCNCGYPHLFAELERLVANGKIERHMPDEPEIPYYRLAKGRNRALHGW